LVAEGLPVVRGSGHEWGVGRATDIDVFQYLDYRSFLRDWYIEHNRDGRTLSYRAFARRAGLKSPNYLKLVIDGARNLSSKMAEQFAKALGLEGEPAGYFVDLVGFNQASTQKERNRQYSRLTSFRSYKKAHRLDMAHAAYHSAWYLPAIRELAATSRFRSDADWVSRALLPPITRAEAQRAIETLVELGMLVPEADGRLRQAEALVSTGPETKGLFIANYHRAMMERAAAAIDLVPAEERDISSLTLCTGEDGIQRLKARVQRFRRELLEQSELEDDPVRVVQLNFQIFPLSNGAANGDDE
jgi:uncharacterized protein (TIGR02147 family)